MRTDNDGNPIPILGFILYYDDNKIIKGKTQTDWVTARQDGIIVLVVVYDYKYTSSDGNGNLIYKYITEKFNGSDYYWMSIDGNFGMGNILPPAEQIVQIKLGEIQIKFGKSILDEDFNRINEIAYIDPEVF